MACSHNAEYRHCDACFTVRLFAIDSLVLLLVSALDRRLDSTLLASREGSFWESVDGFCDDILCDCIFVVLHDDGRLDADSS